MPLQKTSAKINPVVFIFMRPIESGSLFFVNISLFRGRTIWIADAHRDDGKRFVMDADEKLTVFLEYRITDPRPAERIEDCGAREINFDKLSHVK
jgi:hypothetical protein